MGYPVAYRTGAARQIRRLSRDVSPPRPPRPANDNIPLPRPANDNVKLPGFPPLGLNPADVGRALQLLRLLRRFHPLGRALDVLELLEMLMRWKSAGLPVPNGTWHNCFSAEPQNPIWTSQAMGEVVLAYRAGSYGVDVPSFLAGFLDSVTQTDASFSYLPWAVALVQRTDGVAQGEVIAGYHQNADPSPDINPIPFLAEWPALSPQQALSPWRWQDPLKFTPVELPALDPLPPPVWPKVPRVNPEELPNYVAGNSRPAGRVDPSVDWRNSPYVVAPPVGRVRPGKRTKERKFKASTMADLVASALKSTAFVHGKMADFRDLIQALHDSLPKELQLKGKDKKQLTKLFRRVYENLDKMDAKSAFMNVLKEIAEDILGGIGDRLRSKAAAKNNWFKNKIFTSPRF